MRYIIKGGVWKNSQDEILKAAIMKYGLNQWSRISSLLQRKSAKQCKQRWYEWLDPSIKKTQWSRAQDQKLLQLARVFPSQWRTIAPFVGRTPTQCFERYEKLLDLAQGKTNNQSEDLKKLRPGQIDPNPQTKPARLDPIDMDQDEKEMLAQVRVRLANTKGKKAKRKERQKIIQQARRLAQLQKIRQLQMAGVDNIPTAKQIKRMRQKKDIDYNKQVPFKRQIPEFTYKLLDQSQTHKNTFFASTISLQTLQGKRRDVQEELQRKLDKKRLKKLKDRDLKQVLKFKTDFDKPAAFPIQLPQPQLNEKDIENMRKYNITTPLNTQLLNSQTPFGMTPENKIMFSARVNLSLNHQELMTPEQQIKQEIDGVQGLNYLKQINKMQKDPNRMRSVDRLISQRIKTPSSLNQWQQEKGQIKSLFKRLKKPQQQIQFQIPQEQEQEEQQAIIDAEELQRIELQKQRIQQQQRLNQRSEALKRNLPRPRIIPSELKPNNKDKIKNLIQKQIISMLYSDALDFPQGNVKLPETQIPYIQPINKQYIEKSRNLIQEQAKKIESKEKQRIEKAYEYEKDHLFYNQKEKQYYYSTKNEKKDNINEYSDKVESLYKQYGKKVDHNEKKVKKYLAGYQKLIEKKNQLIRIKMQKNSLKTLRNHEKVSMSNRLSQLQAFYKLIYNSI